MERILIFLFTTFFLTSVWGQQTELNITQYDETNGLGNNVINVMLQDSKGYLWFGTADGLCRYDGYNFKIFRKIKEERNSLPGNYIMKLAEDKDGKIWIGLLKDGISCYDPATGIFKNYDVRKIDTAAPLARAVTMLFIDNDNNLWAGLHQKGLLKLNRATDKFSQYNIVADTNAFYSREFRGSYNSAYAMYRQNHDEYWLATHDGLYLFNANTTVMLPVRATPLVKNKPRDDLFISMVADKNGLWLGSWAGGLSNYDFATKKWNTYKFNIRNKNIATTNIVSDLKPKNGNEFWIASIDKGFGIFNKTTLKFSFLHDSNTTNVAVPGVNCSAIMQDKQHNIWLSYSEGLLKIKQAEKRFIYMPVKVGRSDNGSFYGISAMLEDRAGKYLFTGTTFADGLHVTSRHTGRKLTLSFDVMKNEEGTMAVSGLMEDSRGVIWVLTRDFIYHFDPQKNKLIPLPPPPGYMNGTRSNFYTVIREDKKGRIWIASARNGVFCYTPSERTYTHFYNGAPNKKSLPSNVITGLAIDHKERVWIGGTRGCFGYLDNSSGNFVNLDRYGRKSVYNSDNRVFTLYTDMNGNIWAGTDAGLYYYNTHRSIPELKNIYNAESGLRGDVTNYIREDSKNNIWCITSAALCKINRQTGNIVSFGKQDGISKVNLLNGLFLFREGKMAAFSVAGYYTFNPLLFLKKDSVIAAVITSFKIDDKEQYFNNQAAKNEKIIVPANANVISFEFAALDFDRPDKQQYLYMLEGFDKSWVMSGQRRYAGYANIPGGDYVFRVKATNTPGSLNVPIVSMPIHINQPFYKAWWFIATLISMVIVSLYFYFRSKLKKQQQILQLETKAQLLEKEKALVMYESLKQHLNPHFLFNSLTSLNSLIRYDQKKAGDFLEGLSKIYRYILKSRHNETVTLKEEINFVQTFIKLQQTRFEHGFIVNINIDKEFDHCKIAPVTLQNLIENAIKHNIIDTDSPLVIDISTEGDFIMIKNNLQRKNFVETSNKQGLANLLSLYKYLSLKPVMIIEDKEYFYVKIPMI